VNFEKKSLSPFISNQSQKSLISKTANEAV